MANFKGYASLFGIADTMGDMVMPGAFAGSLRNRGARGIRMLFQHDPCEPIGVWTGLKEDARGLLVEGALSAGSSRVRDIAALLADGAIDGLSIGFVPVTVACERASGLRRLIAVDLWEISLVTFPMLAAARITVQPQPASTITKT